jgi:RimJ/RimL family protein N-acetyltransferase
VNRTGAAHHWPIDTAPSVSQARTFWLVMLAGEPIGVVALEAHPGGNVEIVTFGLVPEVIGRGYGGAALSETIDLAWKQPPVDEHPVTRIWLHTSTLDHPHALHNYQRRGLRTFRQERRLEDVPPAR